MAPSRPPAAAARAALRSGRPGRLAARAVRLAGVEDGYGRAAGAVGRVITTQTTGIGPLGLNLVRVRLAPSGRGEFEITDVLNHYIPDGRLFTRVYEGHWTDAGTVPSLLRASELARDDDAVGRLSPPSERPLG